MGASFKIKEQVPSPLSTQILDLCEYSNCWYEDQASYFPPDHVYQLVTEENNLSLLQQQFDSDHLNDTINITPYPHPNDHVVPIIGQTLPTVCEDDCMPPSNYKTSPSFMDPSLNSYLSSNSLECSGIFNGNFFFQGDNPLPPPYTSNELEALSNETQHLVNGLASEITSFESEPFRVANKLSSEERKQKIHRYMKKRNQRNFTKKIKYACRKTLADSRPRVRGRFAKNDEFGDSKCSSNHEDQDTDEDVKSFHVVVKEEEENFESSSDDIFAHISGLNSFKCNYPIQSWI